MGFYEGVSRAWSQFELSHPCFFGFMICNKHVPVSSSDFESLRYVLSNEYSKPTYQEPPIGNERVIGRRI